MAFALAVAISWLLLSVVTGALFALLCRGGGLEDRSRLR